jgi:hypothetical protein
MDLAHFTLAAMRTAEQARQVAVARLATSEFTELEPVLIDSKTEEFGAGWVYYYQSARYMRTRDPQDGLVGNAPLFVPRNGAQPEFISYHRPASESVEAFVCCGNANVAPNAEVELQGCNAGALKVSATQAIRESSPVGLAAAHEAVNQCIFGSAARVPTGSVAAARELVSKLAQLKFVARVTYGG